MKKGIIILLFCFWAITKVIAQLSLGAFTGYLVPIGNNAEDVFLNYKVRFANYRTFSKGNIPLGVSLKYKFKNNILLSLEYANAININDDWMVSYGGNTYKATFYNKLSNYNLGINYLFGKLYSQKLNVLVGLNIGMYSADLTSLYENNIGNKSNVIITKYNSVDKLGFGAKLGINYQLAEQITFDALVRYNYVLSTNEEKDMINRNVFKLENSHLLGAELGLNFNF